MKKKLPIGIQSIAQVLEEGQLYVDKTSFAKKLIDEGKHYFISRPRRFGKSLFADTLEQILKGNKELFKGCQIYDSDYDWPEYPVIHFDFSQIANSTPKKFENGLQDALQDLAQVYEVSISGSSNQSQLKRLIVELSKKNKVVFLVDEYDKPIIDHLSSLEVAEQNRKLMQSFFSTLKGLDKYLKFTFFTGVSKFSQVSIFSGLNNLTDITMDPKYAGMMGYTEDEVTRSFGDYIEEITAERKEQKNDFSREDLLSELRTWYNGYRFSEGKTCVYNPFSTLKFMQNKKPKAYWYSSGTPSFLIDELKKHSTSMVPLDGALATEEDLMDISRLDELDLVALMYQTGYFTIQNYHPGSRRYRLGLPNEEVRTAFIGSLLKNFTKIQSVRSSEKLMESLESYHLDVLFEQIEAGFASFAYQVFAEAKECTYQAMLLSMLYGMGFEPLSERVTNTGRIDVVLDLPSVTYIIELKLDSSSSIALKQIYDKEYFKPYTQKEKNIVIIGANFSSKKRNIMDFEAKLLSPSGKTIKKIVPESSKQS